MNGQELKKILTKHGYLLKDVASKLGLTQPNFSQLVKVQDVKSGTLERICDVLGVKMDFFYKGTRFYPSEDTGAMDAGTNSETKDDELTYLRGQLAATKEAYKTLLDSMATKPSNPMQKAICG